MAEDRSVGWLVWVVQRVRGRNGAAAPAVKWQQGPARE